MFSPHLRQLGTEFSDVITIIGEYEDKDVLKKTTAVTIGRLRVFFEV